MLGQKGLWEKQSYFDASVRVPFLISWPHRMTQSGRTIHQNVSLVDLFPTLCDIANVPVSVGLDGRSLVPLLDGRTKGWPDEVYSELWGAENGPSVMIKQGSLKYFRFDGKGRDAWPDQLFDLAKDPNETHNLIDEPEYADALARLRAKVTTLPAPRKKHHG